MRRITLPFAVGLLFAACSNEPPPEFAITEVCDAAEYGKQVVTSGYLSSPGSMMSCDGETCEMSLGAGDGSASIRIDIPLGRGNNSMDEPPDRWSRSDLLVRDAEGTELRVGDYVRIQGRILNEMACLITPVRRVYAATPPGATMPEDSGSGGAGAGTPVAPAEEAGSAGAANPPSAPAAADGKPDEAPTPAPTGGKP